MLRHTCAKGLCVATAISTAVLGPLPGRPSIPVLYLKMYTQVYGIRRSQPVKLYWVFPAGRCAGSAALCLLLVNEAQVVCSCVKYGKLIMMR